MIKFLDGPAAGVTLMLARAPVFLRVVRSPGGKWDALDQLDDAPRPREEIHVYRVVGTPTSMHVSYRGSGGRRAGGWFYHGEYAYVPEQPADGEVRETAAWRAWTEAQRAKEQGEVKDG